MSTNNVSGKMLGPYLDEEKFEEYIYVAFKYLFSKSLSPRQGVSFFFLVPLVVSLIF